MAKQIRSIFTCSSGNSGSALFFLQWRSDYYIMWLLCDYYIALVSPSHTTQPNQDLFVVRFCCKNLVKKSQSLLDCSSIRKDWLGFFLCRGREIIVAQPSPPSITWAAARCRNFLLAWICTKCFCIRMKLGLNPKVLCSDGSVLDCWKMGLSAIKSWASLNFFSIRLCFYGQLQQNLSVLIENEWENLVLLSLRVTTKIVCEIVSAWLWLCFTHSFIQAECAQIQLYVLIGSEI